MTPTPARLLRAQAETCRARPMLTERDRQRRDYILEAARNMFIHHGRHNVTLPEFCYATRLSPVTVRRHFSDLHHLFGIVLRKHLDMITDAVGRVPGDGPALFAARRAAYLRVTRGICNVPTAIHFLLVRDRFSLPEDELESVELQRRMLGFMLGPGHEEDTLSLLDSPTLDLPRIEAMHAAMVALDHPAEPAQAPEPLAAEPRAVPPPAPDPEPAQAAGPLPPEPRPPPEEESWLRQPDDPDAPRNVAWRPPPGLFKKAQRRAAEMAKLRSSEVVSLDSASPRRMSPARAGPVA